jgi:peptide/nickel transport system permease protein/dipeptide transport system permease protein
MFIRKNIAHRLEKTEKRKNAYKSKNPLIESLFRIRKNKTAVAGMVTVIIFAFIAIFAPLLAPHDPLEQSLYDKLKPPIWDKEGNIKNILGTDDFGRDILSRLIYGARISMMVGFISVSIAMAIGVMAGAIAGFFGGMIDTAIMRVIDIMLSIPYFLLAIVMVTLFGPSLQNAMIAIGIVAIPQFARVVRGSVLEELSKDYIQGAKALGAGKSRLIFKHILPNCMAPVIVFISLEFANAILSCAALSFIGLGAQPPTPEWGAMLTNARALILSAWWVITFPGIMILLAVLGFNLFGDGLRDALDPKLRD